MARNSTALYNGSAAYDLKQNTAAVVSGTFTGTEAPQIKPQGLPEERQQPQVKKRAKAGIAVAPFSVVGLVAVVCMLILVVFGYVQLYEATETVGRMERSRQELLEEQRILQSLYEGAIDLDYVEERAAELGMAQPTNKQTVYVSLSGHDRAEILARKDGNWFTQIFRAIESSASGLVEYLS